MAVPMYDGARLAVIGGGEVVVVDPSMLNRLALDWNCCTGGDAA